MSKTIPAAILALILASLSCGQYVTPVPAVSTTESTVSPSATDTPKPADTATPAPADTVGNVTAIVRQMTVNVHDTPGGAVIGWVNGGDTVTVLGCGGDWCQIEDPAGYVWRGCLSGNEDRECRAK
jgi:hypothetical protein